MASMPRKARICLWTILVLGSATMSWVAVCKDIASPNPPAGLYCLLLLAILAGSKKVQIIKGPQAGDAGSMSLGFVIYFATLLSYGPRPGLLAALISVLSSCLFPKRQRLYQLFFNMALTVLEGWYSGVVFFMMNHRSLNVDPYTSIPAATVTTVVYFLINTSAISAIIGFSSNENPFRLWRDKFLWTAPSYFAAGAVSTLAVVLFHGQHVIYLLLGAPIAYFTYQSYAIYIARYEEKQKHVEELQTNQEHLSDLYLATVKSLALAIDAKDKYTHQHILRVQRYALAIAERMNLTDLEMQAVRTGALLHDIGKLGVPEYVLLKPGRLTEEEFAKIKKHPEIGAAILDPVDFPWPVASAVLHHHERWDGTGYPDGLAGDQIPLIARILSVADVYDALTSTRPYREAWTHTAALKWMQEQSYKSFDPAVIEVFLRVIDDCVGQEENQEDVAGKDQEFVAMQSALHQEPIRKAEQAAHAIQFASSELLTLYEIAQGASSCFGMEDTLNILGDKIQAILPGTTCLFLLQDEDKVLRVRAARGINQEYFTEGRAADVNSKSMEVAQTHKRFIGEYDPNDLLLTHAPATKWTVLRSALIVPMVHQGDLLGTINLYHPEPNAFTSDYFHLLESIADRATRALYNGRMFDRTRSHAITDPLTGLYNMRYVTQYVEQRCARKDPQRQGIEQNSASGDALNPSLLQDGRLENTATPEDRFALFCLDLDSFKPVNDNYGHQKGDQVLRDLSALFKNTVREGDVVARYGGDEFLIVMQDASPAEAAALAARLQEAVEQYDPDLMHPELGALRLGVSIGYACCPTDSSDYASLLTVADTRMYKNKTENKIRQLAQGQSPASPRTAAIEPSLPIYETEFDKLLSEIDLNFSIVQFAQARETSTAIQENERRPA